MVRRVILCLSMLFAALSSFAEEYRCPRFSSDDSRLLQEQSADLLMNWEQIRSVIHINGASKDLTYKSCHDVTRDGSNFASWFEKECKDLTSADGTPFTIDTYLLDSYAGISPIINESYSMYGVFKRLQRENGVEIPARTFIMYGSNRSPILEFFCYRK